MRIIPSTCCNVLSTTSHESFLLLSCWLRYLLVGRPRKGSLGLLRFWCLFITRQLSLVRLWCLSVTKKMKNIAVKPLSSVVLIVLDVDWPLTRTMSTIKLCGITPLFVIHWFTAQWARSSFLESHHCLSFTNTMGRIKLHGIISSTMSTIMLFAITSLFVIDQHNDHDRAL